MKKHCCDMMTEQLDFECEVHSNPHDCPDQFIIYIEKYDVYGILVHDGGASYVPISVCPWCGKTLPDSKMDLWFDTLGEMGFSDPHSPFIPKEFKTDEWYKKLESETKEETKENSYFYFLNEQTIRHLESVFRDITMMEARKLKHILTSWELSDNEEEKSDLMDKFEEQRLKMNYSNRLKNEFLKRLGKN